MQGRKIKHKETGEIYNFLQFQFISGHIYCVIENNNGDIFVLNRTVMQFVKEEPIKTEATVTPKAESMPTLQNTVEVWACMDKDGNINVSHQNNMCKKVYYWSNDFDDFIYTNSSSFKQAFQGIQWEDDAPKKFRITVEPLG